MIVSENSLLSIIPSETDAEAVLGRVLPLLSYGIISKEMLLSDGV